VEKVTTNQSVYMKFVKTMAVLAFLAAFSACGNSYTEREITLAAEKKPSSAHMGKGVWMMVPHAYRKAKSFDGFQTPNMASSISLKVSTQPVEQLKLAYDPAKLSPQKMELIELSEVNYGDSGTGFLSVVHDKGRRIMRYFMSISEQEQTYNITAFCVESGADKFDPHIRSSLSSLYIGEYDEEGGFKLTTFNGENGMLYTKDGQYPTESEDEAVVGWEKIESLHGVGKMAMVENELDKLVKDGGSSVMLENISNGQLYNGKSSSENKKAFVALLALEGEEGGLLVKAHGNSQADLDEMEDFVRGLVLKTTVRGY